MVGQLQRFAEELTVRDETNARDARLDVLAATIASTAMIAQQVAGKSTRDALFLTQFDIRRLPGMMIVSALISFVAAMFAARALANHGPRRVVRWAFLLGAIAFTLEFAASWISKRSIAIVVYLHMALFGATVISLFWSLINERFDPHAAKRAVARIAAGGTLGGVLGGFIGFNIASLTSVRAMLAALAILNAIALVALARLCSSSRPSAEPASSKPPAAPEVAKGIRALRVERYLLTLGVMVALVAATEALTDFAFAAQVKERMRDGRRLMAFFSAFHMGVAIVTFLAQAGLSRRALDRLGLAGTIAALPLVVLVLAGAALEQTTLLTIVILRGGEAVVSNSLWRSAYELLYTPLSQEKKRPMKTLIDVGCDRLGTLVGGAAILGILALALPRSTILWLVVGLAAATLVAARFLQRGYVAALEESLRAGAVKLDAAEIVDATTRRTLRLSVETPAKTDSGDLVTRRPIAVSIEPRTPRDEPMVETIADLLSGDRLRVQKALCTTEDDPRLTPFVIPLLAWTEVRGEALAWLRRLAPRIAGQLADALADPAMHDDTRRRLPRVLRGLRSRVAAHGLMRGLADPRFDVRYECGLALARMAERDSELEVPHVPVLEAVRRELAFERKLLEAEPQLDPLDDEGDAPIFESALSDRASRGLEHVFTLLSLMLDRESLRTAFRALVNGDDALRGTALEYLENVLPVEIRDALWPYVTGRRRPMRGSHRPAQEVLRDLLHSGVMRPSRA